MSTTRYFTHVDKFCDGTAYIEVGDFGTRIVSASGAREDSTWTLDECMGNCLEGAWRELSEADVIVLNIPSAPVDPRDATIAALRAELERKDAALKDVELAFEEARDCVLNERHELAEQGTTNDSINSVLAILDRTVGAALSRIASLTGEKK